MVSIRIINKELAARNYPFELVKAKNYFYFVTIEPHKYVDHSIMVNTINQLSRAQWMRGAEQFNSELNR